MKRTRRDPEDVGMSFLDTLSAGFGAIILMVMMTRVVEPAVVEDSSKHLRGSVKAMQERVYQLRGDSRVLDERLVARQQELATEEQRLAMLELQLKELKSKVPDAKLPEPGGTINDKYALAKQTLTDEMQRLLANRKIVGNAIGGIPVDSEYIIFIIDTSGSMLQGSWPLVLKKVEECLTIYPSVKGVQVMNDQGILMFPQYRDAWIPDTPQLRKSMLQKLTNWSAFSESNPERGIETAISTFYAPDKKISLYVFGDDFAGEGTVRRMIEVVDRLNAKDSQGRRRVRIHAVGFPNNFFGPLGSSGSAYRFANLMRELAQRNNGTFIALPSNH
jgi:hypothetical protein